MVKLFFMAVYYSLLRWFVQSDIVDCIGTFIKYYKISQLIHTQSIAN